MQIKPLFPNGWISWANDPPPEGILIQMVFDGSNQIVMGYAKNSYPSLLWRLTGIGKHQMEPKHEEPKVEKTVDVGNLKANGITGNLSKSSSWSGTRKRG